MSKTTLYRLVSRHSRTRRRLTSFFLSLLILALPTFASADQFTATSLGDHGNVTVMQTTGVFDAYLSNGTYNSHAYKTHKNDIDFFVIFSNFTYQMLEDSSAAFYSPVKNDTRGIGSPITADDILCNKLSSNSDYQDTLKIP